MDVDMKNKDDVEDKPPIGREANGRDVKDKERDRDVDRDRDRGRGRKDRDRDRDRQHSGGFRCAPYS